MDEDRCMLFSFTTGGVAAAVMHFLCAVSGWCCLVFPLFSLLIFLLERNQTVRVACLHTGVVSLSAAVLEAVPTLIWLIILGISHGEGALFVIVTVLYIAIMLIVFTVLLAVEVTCGIKSLRKEPIEVPFISAWVVKLAGKL